MAKQQHGRKTIYLPESLALALSAHPEINFTRICQAAIEAAVEIAESSPQPVVTVPDVSSTTSALVNEFSKTESALRSSRSMLEKIARLAAAKANMVVLTEKEAEIYKQILKMGIDQFVFRTRKEAIEEYKVEIAKEAIRRKLQKSRLRKSRSEKTDETSLVAKEPESNQPIQSPEQEETKRCTDCGDSSDVACAKCGAPLCWVCWTGNDLDAPAKELCQKCQQPPAETPLVAKLS